MAPRKTQILLKFLPEHAGAHKHMHTMTKDGKVGPATSRSLTVSLMDRIFP